MKLFRRLTALLLTVVLCAGLVPVSARAEDHAHQTFEGSFANPLYADIVPADILLPEVVHTPKSQTVRSYTGDIEVAAEALREGMKARQEQITVQVFDTEATDDSVNALVVGIFYEAMEHTGKPTEGDYLNWQWGGVGFGGEYYEVDGGYNFDITYTMTYYTTAVEEQAVDTRVKELLTSLDLDGKSDYEKIKAVYDYICENITYDYDHLNDETYLHQYTAYGALIDGTAVCQGYAVLLYRLALELDVDARFISGIGNGGPHGWNIIEMEDLYYNTDSTWDAGYTDYDYFLKSPGNFPDHTRDEEYDTEEFHKEYPMGSSDYTPPAAHTHNYTATVSEPTCSTQGFTTYVCEECGDSYVADYVDPLDHTPADPVRDNDVKATCAAEGGYDSVIYCSVCGQEISRTHYTYEKLEHTVVTDPRVEPTCSATGLTEGSHCSVCGEVLQAQEVIPALDHTPDDPVRENVVEASCSAEGSYDEVVYCTVCNQQISRTTHTVEKTEHTPGDTVLENVVDPSCSAEGGYDEVVYCTVCDQQISRVSYTVEKTEHDYQDGVCTVCHSSTVQRLAGDDRIATALTVAAALKDALEVDKFDTVILAAAGVGQDQTKFADALSGSYLASTLKAPILLYTKGDLSDANLAFLAENLSDNGVIYLLGGNVSIPAEVEEALNAAGYTTKRLKGDDRYATNLAILEEAGVDNADEVLIAGGQGFADSLSASATGLPIMLVNGSKTSLTEEQTAFLESLNGKKLTILGGNAAVSAELEAAIEKIVGVDVDRIYGETREATSAKIAEKYFPSADLAFITYSRMYPDGLAGGVLANVMGAPLLLTNSGTEEVARAYVQKTGIDAGCVLGGSAVITDETAKAVFGLPEDAIIEKVTLK